jgi:hypothetical protein
MNLDNITRAIRGDAKSLGSKISADALFSRKDIRSTLANHNPDEESIAPFEDTIIRIRRKVQ